MKRKLLSLLLAGLLCIGLIAAAAAVEEVATLRIDTVVEYSAETNIYTVEKDGLYGFYRADGTMLLEPNYAAVGGFHDNMAAVSLAGEWVREKGRSTEIFQGGRFGYVDANGSLIIPMQFSQAFDFSDGRAFVVKNDGQLAIIDRTGSELATFPEAVLAEGERLQFNEGLAVIPVKNTPEQTEAAEQTGEMPQPEIVYLVVDTSGRELCTLTDAAVDYQHGFHNGRIAVTVEGTWELNEEEEPVRYVPTPGTWGYRDEYGVLVIEGQYEAVRAFSGGLAAVCVKDEDGQTAWGLINPYGEEVTPAEYTGAVTYDDGTAALRLESKWAYADQEGKPFTGFDYDEVRPFHEDTAFVRAGQELWAIDKTGKVLFASEAVRAADFSGGVAVLQQLDGACGICDLNGELLVPFEYESAYHWDGYLWLKRGNIWRVYDTSEVIEDRAASPTGAPASVGTFIDVPADSWYAGAVTWATDHDIITGTGGNQFSPDKPCTIGEILTFFWRAVGRPEAKVENPFTDVSASNYYYQAALWAYENGMVEGGTFGAAELCTRGMAVTYLWQLAGSPEGYVIAFSDVSEDSACGPAVGWAVVKGITAGSGDGRFSPDAICNRGQIVTFLYRFLEA